MKLNIGIIDDDLHDIAYLQDSINLWAKETGCEAETTAYASSEYVAKAEQEELSSLDIIFMDVMMPGHNGLDLIETLRKILPERVLYVLVSSNSGYVHDGYSVEAFDFLVKPAQKQKLYAVLDRAVKKIFRDDKGVITFEYGKTLHKINCADIYYIYINGNYANVVAKNNNTYMFRQSLKKLMDMLPQSFVQVARNTIVNAKVIKTISTEEIAFIGTDKTVAPSKTYMSDLITVFKRTN